MLRDQRLSYRLAANPYLPHLARIVAIRPQAKDHRLFQVRFEDRATAESFRSRPGQFVELSVIGTGECPISISSSPTRTGIVELCVRRTGRVTDALFRLPTNSLVGLRGPYGNGYPVEKMEGGDLLLVAGGLGMAPLRSLLWYALDNRADFRRVILLYGCREPKEVLFRDEMAGLVTRADLECHLTVDTDPNKTWPYNVGVVTTLFDQVEGLNPERTYAAICGPPVVYKFVVEKLLELNFSKGRILMSLERMMKCGVGKCLHCSIGHKYTCLDGPIFTYWDAINLRESI
jgi:sulfhydrogenase subunit gamma (sulfur reductase)